MLFAVLYLIALAGCSGATAPAATAARARAQVVARGGAGRGRGAGRARAPPDLDVARATGDRLQPFLEGELARRMALLRRQPVPNLGRRVLDISEIHLEDADVNDCNRQLYDWIPEPNVSLAQHARRLRGLWHTPMYHTNYDKQEPPLDVAIAKMHGLMRDKMYRSREMIDELMPYFDQYKDSLKMRFAFVFRRLDNLLDEMAAIYAYMWHHQHFWHVMKSVFYHQHMLRRHVDVVYIVERTVGMYMWYKERERRLNSILAERMQTEAAD